MYGKFFRSAFEGSMMAAGADVFALWAYIISHTVQSRVEINPKLAAFAIGTTEASVLAALDMLLAPDPNSRSKEYEGRRLLKEDGYQYFVVNHETYRGMRNEEERREYFKLHKRQQRAREKAQQLNGHDLSEPDAPKTPPPLEPEPPLPRERSEGADLNEQARTALAFINKCTNHNFEPVEANLRLARARIKEFGLDRVKQVIAMKSDEWEKDASMARFLRPETLLGATKFAQYVGQLPPGGY